MAIHRMMTGVALAAALMCTSTYVTAKEPAHHAAGTLSCNAGLQSLLPGVYYACQARIDASHQYARKAVSDLREAAYWGDKASQYALGLAYFHGDLGLPADPARGTAWLALSVERGNRTYMRDYALARSRLSAAQTARANALFKQLKPRYDDAHAGKRAERRYNRRTELLRQAAFWGGQAYLAGISPTGPQQNPGKGSSMPLSTASVLLDQVQRQADREFAGLHGHVKVGRLTGTEVKRPPTDSLHNSSDPSS
ncbi:sel1 repeat family protein [Oleiagrimonas sp. C23AA]|uniref:sel1 repeat family protein n=1 Tax=Oleiagrimonas sp. C23AA TaxID=2719047 RepID=UPI001421A3D4|nr:sel1 repeat family protein [Oleiagrimonas sp. C23AA]NII09695.1 sel1 repeat family protein [Oleiagrimonas sp. C23AA]